MHPVIPTARSISLACSLAVLAGAGGALAQLQPTHPNLPYAGHPRQNLDIYIPAGAAEPRPLVVWIHGGGWQNGDKYPANNVPGLVQAGFVAASINYRLSGDATFPAQIHDCKAAIRWLRAHAADYFIDPSRVGVWGSSAGGHLSALVGTSAGVADVEGLVGGNTQFSSRVQAAADYYGPSDFFTMGGAHDGCASAESLMIGQCLGQIKANMSDPNWAYWVDLVHDASPLTHVSSDDPPFHIAHGTADPVVPVAQSEVLHDALGDAGVQSTLRLVQGAGHGLPNSERQYVVQFFQQHLGAPPTRGDMNCDGDVSFGDIDLFVAALGGEEAFINTTAGCNWYHADCNADGLVNFADVDAFVALLGG